MSVSARGGYMLNLSKQPSFENWHLVKTVLPKRSSFFCGRSVPQDVRSQFLYYEKFCLSFDSLLSHQDHLVIQFSLLLTHFSCFLMYAMLLFRLFYSSHTALHCIAPLFFFGCVACVFLCVLHPPRFFCACLQRRLLFPSLSLSRHCAANQPLFSFFSFSYRASLP